MPQLIVRNVPEHVKAQLALQAGLHGRSMEEEVRMILHDAATKKPAPLAKNAGHALAAFFTGDGLKPAEAKALNAAIKSGRREKPGKDPFA